MTAHVISVTDKSGSMAHLTQDVIGGFNAFVEDLKSKTKDIDCRITIVMFDTEYKVLCVGEPLDNAPKFTTDNYVPGGFTALFDAVGRAITEFDRRVKELGEDDKVTLVIQTDGYENASKEHGAPAIKEMINQRTVTGKWNVIYIGAGPDTWEQAQSMGIAQSSYVNTKATKGATVSTYGAMAQSMVRSFSGDADFMEEIRRANKNK